LSDDESLSLAKGVILPRKGVNELRRLIGETAAKTVGVAVAEGNAAFGVDDVVHYMRLVVGEFPDYTAVIPKGNKKKLMLDRNLFSESLHRVSLLSEGKSRCVKMGIKKGSVHLSANSPELGEAEEDVQGEFMGEEMEIGFNARYVMDVLSVIDGARVMIELDHSQSPGIIKIPDDPHFLSVIMPMRI
jgi:DNA polymerase-3 subunit beta